MTRPKSSFWQGQRVLLTGHTGFKGGWAALWLKQAGAIVTGLALPPHVGPTLFDLAHVGGDVDHRIADLRDPEAVRAVVAAANPEVVLHFGAQALVRRGVREPVETFATNVLGTAHLLDALRSAKRLRAILVVTTDKVYQNDGHLGRFFTESDRLGGSDPYAASKAAAELAVSSFARTYFAERGVAVATARGGNVVGGGDFGDDRLIPDIVRAVRAGTPVYLRHPAATRPWQHVLDCLSGYFGYAEALASGANLPVALNFGPGHSDEIRVRVVAEAMLQALNAQTGWIAGHDGDAHEAVALALDSSLARSILGWSDRLGGRLAVRWTADLYKAYHEGTDMRAVTLGQLDAYRALADAPTAGAMS